ncbi:MAG: hypothetical protein LIO54_08355 [Oscillospiraceae bacterium]|nr:hypothetical protein [Oscillospiraceae bacterium]
MKTMTDKQAQRLIDWVMKQGFTREKANEALAYVMGAAEKPPDNKKGSQSAGKQA